MALDYGVDHYLLNCPTVRKATRGLMLHFENEQNISVFRIGDGVYEITNFPGDKDFDKFQREVESLMERRLRTPFLKLPKKIPFRRDAEEEDAGVGEDAGRILSTCRHIRILLPEIILFCFRY